jgi:hypothetical protein
MDSENNGCSTVCLTLEQLQNSQSGEGVDCAGGLVQNQQARAGDQLVGNGGSLLLTSRKSRL